MAGDRVTPLATATQMERSPLKHLVAGMQPDELADALVRATRACENACGGRRLAPFVGLTETHQARGVDPADAAAAVDLGSVAAVTSASWARAVGQTGMVRRVWLDQCAPCFPDLWSYSDITITLHRPTGSTGAVAAADLIGGGPDPETGELWFRVGTHLPVGSRVKVMYSGGYTTVPADLVQACRLMLAAEVAGEDAGTYPGGAPDLNAQQGDPGPAGYLARAHTLLKPYMP